MSVRACVDVFVYISMYICVGRCTCVCICDSIRYYQNEIYWEGVFCTRGVDVTMLQSVTQDVPLRHACVLAGLNNILSMDTLDSPEYLVVLYVCNVTYCTC